MAIGVEYGPRAQTYGKAGFESARDISAYDKLRSLMDMWAQIDEAKKQREHQTGERIGSEAFAKAERLGSEAFSGVEAEKARKAEQEMQRMQAVQQFWTQNPNYGKVMGGPTNQLAAANHGWPYNVRLPF